MHESRRDDYLPALTGLRGIAAAWVLVYHAWQFAGGPVMQIGWLDLTPLFAAGYFGVDLFFVLSGFLLGLPFVRAAGSGERIDLGRFWRNRLRRVLPAYWAQIAILLAVAAASGAVLPDPAVVAGHASLLFNFVQNDSAINPVYWSLPVEWDFYLLLPLLAWPFRRGRPLLWWVPIAVVFAVAFRFGCIAAVQAWGAEGVIWARWIVQLPGRVDQFVFGVGAAWCWLHCSGLRPRALVAAGAAIILVMGWCAVRQGDFIGQAIVPWVYWHFTGVGAGFALVVLGGAAGAAGLGGGALRWLGMVSYSLYLWHYPLLQWQRAWWPAGTPAWAGVAMSLPLILAAAWLSYRFVERPFLGARGRRAESAGVAQTG